MSPQEEPRSLQETASLEAVVRDYGRAEDTPACSDPPVALVSVKTVAEEEMLEEAHA